MSSRQLASYHMLVLPKQYADRLAHYSWLYPYGTLISKASISFISTCVISFSSKLPNLPKIKALSRVANLLSLTSEALFNQLLVVGLKSKSVGSCHCVCVEMKATVTSNEVGISTSAGRFLLPVKLVKGKGVKTMSAFFIYIFLLNHLLYINLPHREGKQSFLTR